MEDHTQSEAAQRIVRPQHETHLALHLLKGHGDRCAGHLEARRAEGHVLSLACGITGRDGVGDRRGRDDDGHDAGSPRALEPVLDVGRDELLNVEIFDTLLEAKVLIVRWRREYNAVRPHSSLGYVPPAPEAIQPWPGCSAIRPWLRQAKL